MVSEKKSNRIDIQKLLLPIEMLFFLFLLLAMIVVSSCNNTGGQRHFIRLDLSKEHDTGRFLPEKGDKVFINLDFANGEKSVLPLEDSDGDWIYQILLNDIFKQSNEPVDTLKFVFFIKAGDHRYLPNGGEESIPMRVILLNDIYDKKPVFIFNETFDDRKEAEVTFTVGVANQKVLGFFKPEEGDILVVSGDFTKWDDRGIPMKGNYNNEIYSVTIPIKYSPDRAVEYRFKILPKRHVILPNDGWESGRRRNLEINKEVVRVPYTEFNDLRRVARFIIDTKLLERSKKFNPLESDILQIELMLDGHESLSDALVFIEEYQYETAVVIPLTVKNIKWRLIKNIKEELTEWQPVEVGLNGKIIEF
ncbi:MAG TPA: hypothetical protein PLW05_09285 [Candidatus Marinimicrobia bacterium]|nr:hypothetical protein [Candidatus Neomarinimicrobiota bacterium]HQH56727.1 hypothetical protein [Candidatus Neomarinimicrobiota bacterium]